MYYNEQHKAWVADRVVNGHFECYIATQVKNNVWKVTTTKLGHDTRITLLTGTEEECKALLTKLGE